MTNFLVQWGINPWGEDTPIHTQWGLVYVAFAFGIGFMLAHNGYKIPLMRNLVKRAIRGEAQA